MIFSSFIILPNNYWGFVLQGKDADIRRARWVMYVVALAAVMLVLLFLYLLTYMRKRRL